MEQQKDFDDSLVLQMIEEVLQEEPSLQLLKELDLVEEITPKLTLWRSMTRRQAERIRKGEVKTESFSDLRKIAEVYVGDLYRCTVRKTNNLFKMNQEGVLYLIDLALKQIQEVEKRETNPDIIQIEKTNCLVLIFRIIVATGCFLLDKELHQRVLGRLGFKEYLDLLGKKPKKQHLDLYRAIIETMQERVNDCIRNTYYSIDIPLINSYPDYIWTLPGMLKPLGVDGVIFYFDETEKEIMIFSGPNNLIDIEYQARSKGKKEYYPQ